MTQVVFRYFGPTDGESDKKKSAPICQVKVLICTVGQMIYAKRPGEYPVLFNDSW